MPLRVTREVIGGVVVTRYNGNNPQGTRETGYKVRREEIRRQKITASQKSAARKRFQEAKYRRRYLGGT